MSLQGRSMSTPGFPTPPPSLRALEDSHMELLMRNSSPLIIPDSRTIPGDPLAEQQQQQQQRNGSPSPLRLNRPRSNPRTRTPMRYTNTADVFVGIPEEAAATENVNSLRHEARRITIRPMAGRAVGTIAGALYNSQARDDTRRQVAGTKSHKQGPSHRKVRRWNNDNFVNLAAELDRRGGGGGGAAKALLQGQADASKYRAIYDPNEHISIDMQRFLGTDPSLQVVRDKFFEGELTPMPRISTTKKTGREINGLTAPVTPEQMLQRIEGRLRRVLIKACENSVPASHVIETFEAFLVPAHRGKSNSKSNKVLPPAWWESLLLEPPSVTHRKSDGAYITRFLFDGDAPSGGFHRLLLHGLCQFHGLTASSSSMSLTLSNGKEGVVHARLLTASGTVVPSSTVGDDEKSFKRDGIVRIVDYITSRKECPQDSLVTNLSHVSSKMQALKV